jgi:dTDP-4-amino-4,6-dideoxygalactose transaminase
VFVVRHPRRDELQQRLTQAGVGTLVHYPVPPHLSGAYRGLNLARGAFPVTENIAASALSLPLGPQLAPAEAERAAEAVRTAVAGI